LATAVLRLFSDAKHDIGPLTGTGFYYDFDLGHKLSQDDLDKIEAEMLKIISEGQKFIKSVTTRDEAMVRMKSNNQTHKHERMADSLGEEKISLHIDGEITDGCRGKYVNSTKELAATKVLGIAGADYRGSE
jgi:threonyl-tRNA synthetase